MRASIIAFALASIPALASAQEAPAAAPAVTAVSAAPAEEPADIARLEDPNIDRVFLMPSADTQPKGTFAFNDYELFMVGLTYGVTDNFQLSATTLAPITTSMPTYVSASAKYRFLSEGRLHLAAQGTLSYFGDGGSGDEEDHVMAGTIGALATFCVDQQCRSAVHANVTGVLPIAANTNSEDFGVIYSLGATVKVAKHVKLLAEVTSAGIHDSEDGFSAGEGALVSYGARFFGGGSIAGDIGFVKPLGGGEGDGDDDEFLLGIPFINFTYRQ
jgi:hypothetical protein